MSDTRLSTTVGRPTLPRASDKVNRTMGMLAEVLRGSRCSATAGPASSMAAANAVSHYPLIEEEQTAVGKLPARCRLRASSHAATSSINASLGRLLLPDDDDSVGRVNLAGVSMPLQIRCNKGTTPD